MKQVANKAYPISLIKVNKPSTNQQVTYLS